MLENLNVSKYTLNKENVLLNKIKPIYLNQSIYY